MRIKKRRPRTGRRRPAPPPWRANQPRVREGRTAAGRANRWGRAPGRPPAEVLGCLWGGWPSSPAAKSGVCLPGEAGGRPETWVREVGCVCAAGGFRGRRRRRGQGRCRGLRGTSERGVDRGGRATCPPYLNRPVDGLNSGCRAVALTLRASKGVLGKRGKTRKTRREQTLTFVGFSYLWKL